MYENNDKAFNDKWLKLAGVDKSKKNNSTIIEGTIEDMVLTPDKAYAIVRHGNKYYIKESTNLESTNPKDFNYIDGYNNKEKWGYSNFSKAEKTMMFLAEGSGQHVRIPKSLIVEQEQKFSNEMPAGDIEQQATEQQPQETPAPETTPTDNEAQNEAPVEQAPEGESTEEISDEEIDAELEAGDDPLKELQSLIGQMGNVARNLGDDVSDQKKKELGKNILSNLGVKEMDIEERKDLGRWVYKGGKGKSKVEEGQKITKKQIKESIERQVKTISTKKFFN
jgi:hypothetical protein